MSLRTALLAAPVFVYVLSLSTPARAEEPSIDVYAKAVRGTVAIFNRKGHGTGFIVDRDKRLVVTAHHVVASDKKVEVIFPLYRHGKVIPDLPPYLRAEKMADRNVVVVGEVIDIAAKADLALVRLSSMPRSARALRLAAREPQPGHDVHSVGGWPRGSSGLWIYNHGKVRQVYNFHSKSKERYSLDARVVEIQSPINPGDSGAPLVNNAGEVVGVIDEFRQDATLISKAVAASEVRRLLRGK